MFQHISIIAESRGEGLFSSNEVHDEMRRCLSIITRLVRFKEFPYEFETLHYLLSELIRDEQTNLNNDICCVFDSFIYSKKEVLECEDIFTFAAELYSSYSFIPGIVHIESIILETDRADKYFITGQFTELFLDNEIDENCELYCKSIFSFIEGNMQHICKTGNAQEGEE